MKILINSFTRKLDGLVVLIWQYTLRLSYSSVEAVTQWICLFDVGSVSTSTSLPSCLCVDSSIHAAFPFLNILLHKWTRRLGIFPTRSCIPLKPITLTPTLLDATSHKALISSLAMHVLYATYICTCPLLVHLSNFLTLSCTSPSKNIPFSESTKF